jgi:hypothetical protein
MGRRISPKGAGLAFGIRALPHVQELTFSLFSQVSIQLSKDVEFETAQVQDVLAKH